MNQPELGKKILELRLGKGLTQTELATHCNVSMRTIQRIEAAEVIPRSFTLKMIFANLDYDFYKSNEIIETSIRKENQFKTWLEQFYINYLDISNLKVNLMKKISFFTTMAILVFFLTKTNSNAQSIENWFMAGAKPKSYESGFDKSNYKAGSKSAYLKSKESKIKGFGTLMQQCDAKDYLGKKIKMTAYIKSEDVKNWAGMWMRIDSKYGKVLGFDNMGKRPIKGTTDWKKYEIILDVSPDSGTLNYGFLLDGTGQIWFDQLNIEVIGNYDGTDVKNAILSKPANLDFEN